MAQKGSTMLSRREEARRFHGMAGPGAATTLESPMLSLWTNGFLAKTANCHFLTLALWCGMYITLQIVESIHFHWVCYKYIERTLRQCFLARLYMLLESCELCFLTFELFLLTCMVDWFMPRNRPTSEPCTQSRVRRLWTSLHHGDLSRSTMT